MKTTRVGSPPGRRFASWIPVLAFAALLIPMLSFAAESREEREREREERRREVAEQPLPTSLVPGIVPGSRVTRRGTAVVNVQELARLEALGLAPKPPVRVRAHEREEENEMSVEPGANIVGPAPEAWSAPPFVPMVASPSPSVSYMGLDDIPMVDSSYIIIPPDVHGAVGPTRVMESFNNNYRVRDKTTGVTILTVGTATFWNPVIADKTLLAALTDPRTVYDPINNRWISCMQTASSNDLVLIAVSQTSDPTGSWFLYSFGNLAGGPNYLLDFPTMGFNKNWIAVTINRYSTGGSFQRGIAVVASYPDARAGTLSSATVFTQAAGTHFATAPCVTLSATEDTLFLITHLASAGATFEVDRITGTPAAPVYTSGAALTRPGGGWTQPGGNLLPQSGPNAGTSACAGAPCPIETQDSQVRSEPIYRVDSTTGRGYIYYTQTVGLPAGAMTHTAVQWTKITPSITAAFADGGRIEDATATSTNGGKWYAYPRHRRELGRGFHHRGLSSSGGSWTLRWSSPRRSARSAWANRRFRPFAHSIGCSTSTSRSSCAPPQRLSSLASRSRTGSAPASVTSTPSA